MRLLLLAPPGAGKGTQGQRLAAHFGVVHISSGDLLRAEIDAGTALGGRVQSFLTAGDLVPDELMAELLERRITGAAQAGGYVLDGFPRTLSQAELAYEVAQQNDFVLDAVLFLDVSEDDLVARLLARGRGADDTEATIRHRLEVYLRQTEPLIDYYRERGLLHEVDGAQSIDAVTKSCLAALAGAES